MMSNFTVFADSFLSGVLYGLKGLEQYGFVHTWFVSNSPDARIAALNYYNAHLNKSGDYYYPGLLMYAVSNNTFHKLVEFIGNLSERNGSSAPLLGAACQHGSDGWEMIDLLFRYRFVGAGDLFRFMQPSSDFHETPVDKLRQSSGFYDIADKLDKKGYIGADELQRLYSEL